MICRGSGVGVKALRPRSGARMRGLDSDPTSATLRESGECHSLQFIADHSAHKQLSGHEWGMFHLQERANRFRWDHPLEVSSQHANVTYDWPKNQLQIQMVIYPRSQSLQRTTAREVCGSLIHQMKVLLGATPGMEMFRESNGVVDSVHGRTLHANWNVSPSRDLERI
jgi:hypothetical protein